MAFLWQMLALHSEACLLDDMVLTINMTLFLLG